MNKDMRWKKLNYKRKKMSMYERNNINGYLESSRLRHTDKMKRLKNSWMQGMSEDEDGKLINLEEEEEVEDRRGNYNGWE